MRIVCSSCGAKYEVKDEKVRKKVFKIRCKRCSHEFVVRGEQEEAQEEASAAAPEAASEPSQTGKENEATKVVDYSARQRELAEEEGAVWHVVINREQVGGLTAQDVLAYLARGEIDPDTFTWREGMADWARLSTVPEFADAVAQGTAQAPVAEDEDLGATAAIDIGSGMGVAAAATPDAEDDVMASNNVAEASSSGLFGGIDDVPDPRISDPSQLRNQRNENSVLFSLDSLTEGAQASRPAPQVSNTGGSDASGLIDMSLLDNEGVPSNTAAEMDALFGAGSGAAAAMPMQTGAPVRPLVQRKKSKLPMVLGIAAAVIILVGGAVFVTMQLLGKDKPATTQVANNAKPPPTKLSLGGATKAAEKVKEPEADKNATPTPAPVAEPVKTDERSADSAPAAGKKKRRPTGKPRPKPNRPPKKKVDRKPAGTSLAAPPTKPARKPRKPRRPAETDDVDDILGALNGKPPSTPTGRTPSSVGGGGPSPSDDPLLPERLGRKDILSVVRRGSSKVLNCKAGTGASGTVKVKMTVSKTGRVTKATVTSGNFQGTPVGRCVEGKVRSFRFPAFRRGPMSFTMPFKL